ncbi:ATP-grasp fold amidoligase family protein [uncultured Serinicoccus sp.]|uniref:ATP-grasp fold amidoligase family protein n=1 Tax=uncultured Serinicoccus sp. TaxID=735514 RepID=UPI0026161EA7|nr:ATP-grasp fold amidoligase family protein [uncultured Serinicoccus sp.]
MNLRREVIRRIPPLEKRDAELRRRNQRIRALEAERTGLEQELDAQRDHAATLVDPAELARRSSFTQHLVTLRRVTVALRELDPERRHPLRQVPFKLRNYRLAASHGIPTPRILGVWEDPAGIDLDALPDEVVVKSDGGAGSHGVLPLRRVAGGGYQTLDGVRSLSADEVREHFTSRAAQGRISGPFFAEEVLRQPGGGPIPDDVKINVSYGEVLHVMLRRVSRHGHLRSMGYRYVDADGAELGAVMIGREDDRAVPVPPDLPEMVEMARHLSLATGLPFIRVDLYGTERGAVLGELTRTPGGRQPFRADHDERMGLGWEAAASRLELDLVAGRPPGILHGEHPVPELYPEGHVSRSADPGAWAPRVVPCAQCG